MEEKRNWNHEHFSDPTADRAIGRVMKQQKLKRIKDKSREIDKRSKIREDKKRGEKHGGS